MPTSSPITSVKLQRTPAKQLNERQTSKKKVAVTISLIGKTAYSTLKDLCLPYLTADKTYDQLTQILKDYYKPKGPIVYYVPGGGGGGGGAAVVFKKV